MKVLPDSKWKSFPHNNVGHLFQMMKHFSIFGQDIVRIAIADVGAEIPEI